MIRALTIFGTIVVLAVSASPASAGLLSSPLGLTTKPKPAVYDHGITQGWKPPPRDTAARFELSIDGHSMFHGTSGDGERIVRRGAAKAPRPAGNGIIAILIGAKAAATGVSLGKTNRSILV